MTTNKLLGYFFCLRLDQSSLSSLTFIVSKYVVDLARYLRVPEVIRGEEVATAGKNDIGTVCGGCGLSHLSRAPEQPEDGSIVSFVECRSLIAHGPLSTHF